MNENVASAEFSINDVPEELRSRFQIEGLLGRGGMGTVYRAVHLNLDRTVALKVINPEFAANSDVAQRFAREARLMAKLRHPRAAMIYDTGTLPDGHSYIVMEYVEGKPLSQIIRENGPFHFNRAVEIGAAICDVLAAAHEIGIIHRDLKPANVMLNERGVFVLDFGIAKILESHKEENLGFSMTGTGIIVGSPYYMSPEQCLGQPVEARSDLYSLGVLLYEALTGNPPFTDKTISAVIVKHATAHPQPLTELRPDIPLPLVAAINQLLAKNPEERPANAAAARAALESAVSGHNTLANIESHTAVMPQPAHLTTSQSNTGYSNQTTRHTNTASSTQHLAAAAQSSPSVAASGGGHRGRNIAIAASALLIAVLSLGSMAAWLASRSGATTSADISSNKNSNSSKTANTTDHSHHDAMTDTDFVANTTTEDKTAVPVSAQILSSEEADKVITKITQDTHHQADGMQIVKTPKDSALVCLHNKISEGKTHMFAVERPNADSPWDITVRTSLDVPEFISPNWTFEPLDVDKDGFEEVIFSATNAGNTARRVLIYVPRSRQSYSILAEMDGSGKVAKTTLSPNAQGANVAAFRAALEQAVKPKG